MINQFPAGKLWDEYDKAMSRISDLETENDSLRTKLNAANNVRIALQLVLDCVDYTSGSCGLTEMVGGVLPAQIISKARVALSSNESLVKGGEE